MKLYHLPAALTTLLLVTLLPGIGWSAELRYQWQDEFSKPEREMLTVWIDETAAGVEALVGPLPFPVSVRFYRRDGAREPVPWAHTRRSPVQGVDFYVDPSFPFGAFQSDWTAPHELSHLVLPFLGSSNAWFAEGFASWMQYQVMMQTGQLTATEASHRYLARLDRARSGYPFDDEPFADAAPRLRAERKYPVMYWGGAAYFLQVDAALRDAGKPPLIQILARYLNCCRRPRSGLDDLAAQLDQLSATTIFRRHLAEFRSEPGFPGYDLPSEP